MGKYYDRLVEINESLDKVLEKKGIQFDEGDEEKIAVSPDMLTPDQKKDMIVAAGVDANVVKDMKDDKEIDAALKATLSKNGQNESAGDAMFVLGVKDPDLDLDGYVSGFDGKAMNLIKDYGETAMMFKSQEEAQNQIDSICSVCHYDPATFTIVQRDVPIIEVPADGCDCGCGDDWICLDPTNRDAVVI